MLLRLLVLFWLFLNVRCICGAVVLNVVGWYFWMRLVWVFGWAEVREKQRFCGFG